MIRTNADALKVFGIGFQPSIEQIKSRYHELLKQIHPDETGSDSEDIYVLTEAYQFLLSNYKPPISDEREISSVQSSASNVAVEYESNPMTRGAKVFGAPDELRAADARRAERNRYHKLQKQHKEHEKERKLEFERELEEAAKSRKDDEYQDALDRIHAIRAAEVTARIIEAMLYPDINES